jgi:hypothetical protein
MYCGHHALSLSLLSLSLSLSLSFKTCVGFSVLSRPIDFNMPMIPLLLELLCLWLTDGLLDTFYFCVTLSTKCQHLYLSWTKLSRQETTKSLHKLSSEELVTQMLLKLAAWLLVIIKVGIWKGKLKGRIEKYPSFSF